MPDIRTSDFGGIPYGNTAGRPANATTGKLYSNGETARLELYTSSGSWENIVQEVPSVSSISGDYLESSSSGVITIYGTNFVSGAVATAIGSNGAQVNATSTVYNSIVQLTATFTGLSNQYEPYGIKVTNPSNLFGLMPNALYINASPVWTTAAGSLGNFGDEVAISVSAIAADDSTITYAVASGSSLPSGISLNTATGLISGTLPNVSSNTTYTFTLTASDGSNPAVSRQFSFTSNAAPTWVTPSGSLGTFTEEDSINIQLEATDPTDYGIIYSVASGSSLPSGISINSSTGIISGTLPNISSNTSYNFTINASDGINTVPREFSINSNYAISFEYLMVGGGGGGGGGYNGGGGGAGGILYGTLLRTPGQYNISIGSAGSGAGSSFEGSGGANTSAFNLIAYGGGKGSGEQQNMGASGSVHATGGGSAGGRGHPTYQAASATPAISGQGNIGGTGDTCCANGGGGGAGSAGGNSNPGANLGGAGGAGIQSSITGVAVFYAGGGGGGSRSGGSGGSGGSGVGGSGGSNNNGNNASSYGSGGGGGGAPNGISNGGNGSSGVLIIAYPSTEPAFTISGGLTYDQPSRSGYRVYRFTGGAGTITL